MRFFFKEKLMLSLQITHLEKVLLQEKQRFLQRELSIQREQQKLTEDTLQLSKKLVARLEQEEKQRITDLEESLRKQSSILREESQELSQLKKFLEKWIKIEKVLYIERRKEEKKCTIYYENGSEEEKVHFTLKEFFEFFPRNLIFCNRSILVNTCKGFSLLEEKEMSWVLLFQDKRFQVTKHNLKNIQDAFSLG